jgi:hypothetical protein
VCVWDGGVGVVVGGGGRGGGTPSLPPRVQAHEGQWAGGRRKGDGRVGEGIDLSDTTNSSLKSPPSYGVPAGPCMAAVTRMGGAGGGGLKTLSWTVRSSGVGQYLPPPSRSHSAQRLHPHNHRYVHASRTSRESPRRHTTTPASSRPRSTQPGPLSLAQQRDRGPDQQPQACSKCAPNAHIHAPTHPQGARSPALPTRG